MKTYSKIILSIVLLANIVAYAQVGINGNQPHKAAAIDMRSVNNKGLLLPNVFLNSLTDAAAVGGTPAQGLWIYNTNTALVGNASIPGGTGYFYWETNTWKKMSGLIDTGDNLGNHTAAAGIALNMSNNDIKNSAKLSTQTMSIAKGIDGIEAAANSIAVAADNQGNINWKPKNIDLSAGTIIAVNGELVVGQEISCIMNGGSYTYEGINTPNPIGNIGTSATTKLIDNKNRFTGTAATNSFTVDADGMYFVTISASITDSKDNNAVIGIYDNTAGKWICRTTDNVTYMAKILQTVPLQVNHTYSFACANEVTGGKVIVYDVSSGSTGTGYVSYFSIKRLF